MLNLTTDWQDSMYLYMPGGMSVLEAALLRKYLTCSRNLGSPGGEEKPKKEMDYYPSSEEMGLTSH